jgi:hypothetical protein
VSPRKPDPKPPNSTVRLVRRLKSIPGEDLSGGRGSGHELLVVHSTHSAVDVLIPVRTHVSFIGAVGVTPNSSSAALFPPNITTTLLVQS